MAQKEKDLFDEDVVDDLGEKLSWDEDQLPRAVRKPTGRPKVKQHERLVKGEE